MGMGEVLRLVGSWMERQWRLLTFSILVLIYWTELKFMLLRVWRAEKAGRRRKGLDVRDKIKATREAVKNLPCQPARLSTKSY